MNLQAKTNCYHDTVTTRRRYTTRVLKGFHRRARALSTPGAYLRFRLGEGMILGDDKGVITRDNWSREIYC